MDASLVIWLIVAVFVFWGVGAYKRLMRMRAQALLALGVVETQMQQYGELVRVHLLATGYKNTMGVPLCDSTSMPKSWTCLLDILQALEHALKSAIGQPLTKHPVERLAMLLSGLDTYWQQLMDAPPDLAGDPLPEAMQLQWRVTSDKVQVARDNFNHIVRHYNESIAQFPVSLFASAMGFHSSPVL
jgi:LemA protein